MNAGPRKKVTIVDVAREAGVSHATVSRALNNSGYVRETTRTRVLEAAKKLGYVVNAQARALAGGSSSMIGLIISSYATGFMGGLVQSIDAEMRKTDYNLVIFPTYGDAEREVAFIQRVMNGMVDGLLVVLVQSMAFYDQLFTNQDFPYILIGTERVGLDHPIVGPTNWQGAYDMTRYLLDLGHRRIGFLKGPERRASAAERLAGYQAALRDYDVQVEPNLVVKSGYNRNEGYDAALDMLQKYAANPPTAIFGPNDNAAVGALDAARECGLRVPEDISIVGFDDQPVAQMVHPKLTTVLYPMEQMGREAIHMLIERIENPDSPPRSVTLSTRLIIRDSSGPPRET